MNTDYLAYWWRAVTSAVKKNVKPGLALQLFGVSIIVAYYLVPSTRPLFEMLILLKQKYGFFYSAVATCFFGAVLPVSILFMLGRMQGDRLLLRIFFIFVYWIWKGIEVDLFYRGQSIIFGDNAYFLTIAKKVAVDQFIYNPLWAAPCNSLYYIWLDSGCSFKRFRARIDRSYFTRTFPVMLVSTWTVWIPAVAIIYSLPQPLQVPIFNLVLCFWVLILDLVVKRGNGNEQIIMKNE
jgi:hypothetical protein